MFGIGSTELLLILVVALLVLGPKSLSRVAQSLGRAMGEFRKASTEFQRTLNTEIAFEEKAEEEAKKKAEAARAGQDAAGQEAAAQDTAGSGPAPGHSPVSGRAMTTEAAAPGPGPDATPPAAASGARVNSAAPGEKA
ncbi:MAG: twin-arginine translocase TatA/TatE family subunit [Desulfovibrionaceae bacterium]|nr:twin-arginine translocase TatA/TatE family subunit [Desulfovibrionaceae bacterium]